MKNEGYSENALLKRYLRNIKDSWTEKGTNVTLKIFTKHIWKIPVNKESMQLRKFLNKNTAKKTKIKVLNKMFKIAKANGGTISVEKAREVVKNAFSN